jgi:hypothetical protein
MRRHSLRLLAAILTFTVGVAGFWVLNRLETVLSNRVFKHGGVSPIKVAPFNLDLDSAEIYRLLLKPRNSKDEIRLIVLTAETSGCAMYEVDSQRAIFGENKTFQQMMKGEMPKVEEQTLENYLERNKSSGVLKVSVPGVDYVLAREGELPDYSDNRFWAKFYEKYPLASALVTVSNIGFNDQHDQALVYLSRGCGYLCGSGGYVLLQKVNGKWEIRDQGGVWIS